MKTEDERTAGSDDVGPGADRGREAQATGGKSHRFRNIVASLAVLAVLGGGYYAWDAYATRHPSTGDAYVGANVVHIAPQVSGTVDAVGPASYAHVAKGDLLFRIDQRPFKAAVDIAQAGLAEARQKVATLDSAVNEARAQLDTRKAAFADASKESQRVSKLVADGTLPSSQGDAALAALKEAKAAVSAAESTLASARAALGAPGDDNPLVLAAKARLEQAKLDLANTTVVAPGDGYVGKVSVRPGSMAGAGVETMQLVESGAWWIDANFKESDLARIRPGQTAQVSVDMLSGRQLTGKVVAVSPASGTVFSLFPADNATGNWVKVAQRFPVRIQLDGLKDAGELRLGASSRVTVNTAAD